MRRVAIAVVLLLSLEARALGALGDTTWNKPVHAESFPLDGLPLPASATAAVTVHWATPGNCIVQSTGVDGSYICAANPVASIAFTDPATNTGTSTAPIIGVKFDNASVTLNGGGALQTGAQTGAITKAPGATSTVFGSAGLHSVLMNATGGSAVPAFVGPGTTGQFVGIGGWSLVPASSVTGLATVATSGLYVDLIGSPTSLPPSGAAGGDLAGSTYPNPVIAGHVVTAAKIQTFAGLSLVGVAGGSTADVAAISCSGDGQTFWDNAGTLGCAVLPYSKLSGTPTSLPPSGAAGGGLGGTYPNPTVTLAAGAAGFGSGSNTLTGDAARFHWDGTNFRFGLRTAAPAYEADFVDEAGAADRGLALRTFISSTAGPSLRFLKYRGSFASPTTVTNTDYLGRVGFDAYDGTNPIQIGEIVGHVTSGATVATGSVPSEIGIAMSTTGVTDPYANNSLMALRVLSNNVNVGMGLLANDTFRGSGLEIGAFSGTTNLGRTIIAGGGIGLYGSSSAASVSITRADGGTGIMSVGFAAGGLTLAGSSTSVVLGNGMGAPYGLTFRALNQNQVEFSGASSLSATNWGLFRVTLVPLSETIPVDSISMAGAIPLNSYFFRGATYTFAGGTNTNATGFNEFTIGAPTLNSGSSSAISMATLAILGAPNVTGITGPIYALDLQGANGDISLHTAGGIKISGVAGSAIQVTSFSAGYIKANGSGVFSSNASVALADLATCSSGQVVGMVAGVQGCVTPSSSSVTLTGPVAGSGSGTIATSINFGGGSITGLLALANESSPTGTGVAKVSGSAWVTAAGLVNLASEVTGLLPLTGLANCAPGQIVGMIGGVEGCVTPTAGTVYTGLGPIVVLGSTIDCPTCAVGTFVSSVGNVAGQTTSTGGTTPAIGLATAGPGAGSYGGAGIAGVDLDAFGRVSNIFVASFQPALSFPAAHFITDSTGSGLTGDTSFQRDPTTNLISVAGLVVNGASPFPNSALIVNSSTNVNRDREQHFLGGGSLPAAGPHGDATLFGIFPHNTAVEAGVTSGIYATMRIENLTYTGTGQTITEADGLYIDGHPNLSGVSGQTYALHVSGGTTSLGDVILGGAVSIPLYGFGSGGIATIDATGALGVSQPAAGVVESNGNGTYSSYGAPGIQSQTLTYQLTITTAMLTTMTTHSCSYPSTSSQTDLSSTAVSYPTAGMTATFGRMDVFIFSNAITSGSGNLLFYLTGNSGTAVAGPITAGSSFSSGTTGTTSAVSGSGVFGICVAATPGISLLGASVNVSVVVRLAPFTF